MSEVNSEDQQKTFRHLIDHVMDKNTMNIFTQKFKNDKAEKKYLKAHNKNLKLFGKIYLLAVGVIFLIYLAYILYK